MPKGRIKKKKEQRDNFEQVDDIKIRSTLMMMADKYDEQARKIIQHAYSDKKLLRKWQKIRDSNDFQVRQGKHNLRKLIEFPNAYVFDFVDTILARLYGVDWLYEDKALEHELVKPWLVVNLKKSATSTSQIWRP